MGSLLDITERKQTEETLQAAEQNFRNSLDNSPLGVRIIDARGKTIYANRAILDIYGYRSIEEFKSIPAAERHTLQSYAERQERVSKREAGEPVPDRFEQSIIRKDGEVRNLEVFHREVLWGGEKQFQLIYQDITERKRAAAELQKMEKLESVGTLAGGIAHDFNNILTGILGNITLAERHVEPEGKAAERLLEARKASLKARDLTQQLLTFARGGAPVKKLISIAQLVQDSTTFALRGSNVRCDFSLPDDLRAVEADEGQMNQVITNLVINADEAMPEGGVMNITAHNTAIKRKGALPLPKGDYVEIDIADHGVGIAKKHLGRIFDPYFTTKQKGAGLGLATTYAIIKNHGGYITAESTQNIGTTFHIYLPASAKPAPIQEETVVELPMHGKGRILAVDDEEMIREMLSSMLPLAGYEVELTSDGAEAVERYVKARESGKPFSAVILDLTVPGGMGGKETIRKLLEIDPSVKAIVASGYATDPIMADYQKYGFSAVIVKPFSVGELEKTLRDLLSRKGKKIK